MGRPTDDELCNQVLRDLQWMLSCPPLIERQRFELLSSLKQPVIIDTVRAAKFVSSWSEAPLYRVGQYFEKLFELLLSQGCSLSIIETQYQVFEGTRTIGELDFLIANPAAANDDDGLIQIETTVKFYLYDPRQTVNGSHFIGPNSKDNFERKRDRLFDHQLQCGRRLGRNITSAQQFALGRIFYHPDWPVPEFLPTDLSQRHQRGIWLYRDEHDQLLERYPKSRFQILGKPFWLSNAVLPCDSPAPLTSTELLNQLKTTTPQRVPAAGSQTQQNRQRPLLVAVLDLIENEWREVCRCFLMDRSWPTDH